MITIPVLSKTEAIMHTIRVMVSNLQNYYDAIFFDTIAEFDAYVQAYTPELAVLDATESSLGAGDFFEQLANRSEYVATGIILIAQDEGDRMTFEMDAKPHLLLCMNERDFLRNGTRLFKILSQNMQFVFNRFIQRKMRIRENGVFICDNDSSDIIIYTNLLVTYLANTGRVDLEGKFLLQTALMEMLLNALEHGNCCINYNDKTSWLESGRDMLELIAEKNRNPEIAKKKIYITYEACTDETHFSIADEGAGFDWEEMLKREIVPNLHGMGIKMTERMVKRLSYNDKGNEVFFSIDNANASDFVIMRDFSIDVYGKGDCIKIDANGQNEDVFFVLRGALFAQIDGVANATCANADGFAGATGTDAGDVMGATGTGGDDVMGATGTGGDGVMGATGTGEQNLHVQNFLPADIIVPQNFAGQLVASKDFTTILRAKKSDFDAFLQEHPCYKCIFERAKNAEYRQK